MPSADLKPPSEAVPVVAAEVEPSAGAAAVVSSVAAVSFSDLLQADKVSTLATATANSE